MENGIAQSPKTTKIATRMTGALDNEWDTDIQVSETDSENIFLSSVHLGQNRDVLEKVSANY
jgi:hypothetical protein